MAVYLREHTHGLHATEETIEEEDDWETDPEPANIISEEEQRWGSSTLHKNHREEPSEGLSIRSIREHALRQDTLAAKSDPKLHEKKAEYGAHKVNTMA